MDSNVLPRSLRVLVDTNVLLDQLLTREPWHSEAQTFWQACDSGHLIAYLPASTLTDIYYISRRLIGAERARHAVTQCLEQFGLVPVYRAVLQAAIAMPGPDFEDNVQIACAEFANLDIIVTRNAADFRHTSVPIMEPGAVAGYHLP